MTTPSGHSSPSFSQLLTRSLLKAAFVFAAAALFAIPAFMIQPYSLGQGTEDAAESIRPTAPGSPEALIAEHACHTDGIHDGDTSAVVTLPGATGPIWTGDLRPAHGERIWGAVVFDQLPAGATVHATC